MVPTVVDVGRHVDEIAGDGDLVGLRRLSEAICARARRR
jgi:hypothetical protein